MLIIWKFVSFLLLLYSIQIWYNYNLVKTTQQYLTENGISPSVQRLAIMNYLLTHHTHPTVNEIYAELLPAIPTLSKTTVHNTLKLFVQHKIALHVNIDERNARFDGIVKAHAHFLCKKCGRILDVPLHKLKHLYLEKSDFTIEEAYFNIKGICKTCKTR